MWHTLEVGGEDEDLNALLTLPRSPWTRGCSLLSIPVCSCTFEAMGGVRRQTQGQVQANAGRTAGDEHHGAVHGEMRMEEALGVLGSRRGTRYPLLCSAPTLKGPHPLLCLQHHFKAEPSRGAWTALLILF